MATKSPIKKQATEDVLTKAVQTRPTLGRFRLQVDRQTKSTFESVEEAEVAGKAIKEAFPLVQVSIYDAAESAQKILE